MAESSIFWSTGSTGDGAATYTENQLFAWIARTFLSNQATEGVLANYANQLAVSGTATPLQVATGAAIVYGIPYESTASVNLAVTTPTVGTTGGRVILRANFTAQTVRALISQSADGTLSPPALTQTANTTWEISLATYTVTTGGVIALTDTRTYCHFNSKVSPAMFDPGGMYVARRQGGSSTDPSVPGTTNYTIANTIPIQFGAATIAAGPTANVVNVTFPVGFNTVPLVLVSSYNNDVYVNTSNVTTTGFVAVNNNNTYSRQVNWVAIGLG